MLGTKGVQATFIHTGHEGIGFAESDMSANFRELIPHPGNPDQLTVTGRDQQVDLVRFTHLNKPVLISGVIIPWQQFKGIREIPGATRRVRIRSNYLPTPWPKRILEGFKQLNFR
jgi:hypothetical protein